MTTCQPSGAILLDDLRQVAPSGRASTRRLTKLNRTPRTPASCSSASSASVTSRPHGRDAAGQSRPRLAARRPSRGCRRRGRSPARRRCGRSRGGRAARTAAPWTRRTACTCARARTGTRAPGPKTWQCASTAPVGQAEPGPARGRRTSRASRGSSRRRVTVMVSPRTAGRARPAARASPYMSRPSSPSRNCRALVLLVVLALRRGLGDLGRPARAGTTTTPSTSATTTSPGRTSAFAQTTGTLTEPRVALTVPLALIAREKTGKSICSRSATSRTPPSMTRPRQPRARNDVASSSPKKPSSLSVGARRRRRRRRRWICSAATCIIQLSPGWSSTVTAGPQSCAPGRRAGCRAASARPGPSPRGRWRHRTRTAPRRPPGRHGRSSCGRLRARVHHGYSCQGRVGERAVEPREDPAGVAGVDGLALVVGEVRRWRRRSASCRRSGGRCAGRCRGRRRSSRRRRGSRRSG